jgi:hypothetical protein
MIQIGQRPVVTKKIYLNITITIANYQRSKWREKLNAEREDIISQNRRHNHGRVEMRMRTALERRLGYGLLKRDGGHLWIWDFCDRGRNLENKRGRENSEVVSCIRVKIKQFC